MSLSVDTVHSEISARFPMHADFSFILRNTVGRDTKFIISFYQSVVIL